MNKLLTDLFDSLIEQVLRVSEPESNSDEGVVLTYHFFLEFVYVPISHTHTHTYTQIEKKTQK